jgi:hypothetical protein
VSDTYRRILLPPLHLSEQPPEHRPERPILLAVDQKFGEGAALWVAPELSDPVGSLEVGEHQDVEEFGAGSGTEGVETLSESAFELVRSHLRRSARGSNSPRRGRPSVDEVLHQSTRSSIRR